MFQNSFSEFVYRVFVFSDSDPNDSALWVRLRGYPDLGSQSNSEWVSETIRVGQLWAGLGCYGRIIFNFFLYFSQTFFFFECKWYVWVEVEEYNDDL